MRFLPVNAVEDQILLMSLKAKQVILNAADFRVKE